MNYSVINVKLQTGHNIIALRQYNKIKLTYIRISQGLHYHDGCALIATSTKNYYYLAHNAK